MRLLIVLLSSVFATSAFAAAGDAGCGLGSLVMQKNTKVSQTFAATTNSTFTSQLLGITSGTSNCSANSFVYNEMEATHFAEANLPSLKIEMARGTGENLTAFAQTLGCKDTPALANMTKSKYSEIFPSNETDAHQMLNNVKSEIQSHPELKNSCVIAG